MNTPFTRALAAAALAFAFGACRGGISDAPPVHLVQDMDFQPKLKAQSQSNFAGWADHRTSRLPVKDTFARGTLPDNRLLPDPVHAGKNPDGSFITQNPVELTADNLARGKQRFEINCAPCHGLSGRGGNQTAAHGIVGVRWSVVIPSFHEVKTTADGKPAKPEDNRVPLQADGAFLETMTYGKNTMPSYGERITLHDRWCIVHYIRALQLHGKQ